MHFFIFLIAILSLSTLYPQKPTNDDCNTPLTLKLNQWIDQNNEQATINKSELPQAVPYTCVNTFENDLWYVIPTQNITSPLIIIIYPYLCNTPAGVQAILYSQYDCKNLNNNILYCFTKDVSDTVKFVVARPNEFEKLMLYVDGFDGTICQFKIGVFELTDYHPFDFCKYLRFDYVTRTNQWKQPLNLFTKNNQIFIQWAHENPDVLGYAIQIKMQNGYKTLSCFNAQNYVFVNQNFIDYVFNPDQLDTEKKCFRLLVYYKNEIIASPDYCIEPKVIKDFWVSPPKYLNNNEFTYIYKLLKSTNATIVLKNSEGKIVKSKTIKIQKGNYEGSISIDGLPKSQYFFQFCVNGDCFEYPLELP
jgi:hypothetical protein